MARKAVSARTTKINPAASASPAEVEHYCRDLNGWPRSWMGSEKDLPPGEKLVASFRPFLEHLVASDLSPKTIQKHVDNLWVLGGEIIRDLNESSSLRKITEERLLSQVVSEDGGPLIHHGNSEDQQRSFDATCRKLHHFFTRPQR